MAAVAPAVSPTRPESERERGRAIVIAAVGTMVCLWASAFVAIRFADRELSPGALALGRLLVGSAALGALVVARRAPLPGRRQLSGIVVCGVLWFGIYNVALNAAERRVDAGTAAMLVNIGPILIAILAGSILHEGFPPRLLAGCLVSFAGAVVIGLATSRHSLHESLGAVLCLVAAVAYAGGVVAQKPVLRHASPLSVTWLACTIGAISCLPYAGSLAHGIAHAGAPTIGWMIYLGPSADRRRLRPLGVRAGPHDRRPHGLDHLPRPPARPAVRMGLPRRSAAFAGVSRWRAVPRRRRAGPHPRSPAGQRPIAT